MDTKHYTLVMGASENPERYSYKAIKMLLAHHQPTIGVAKRAGIVDSVEFVTNDLESLVQRFSNSTTEIADTVSLYLNPKNQVAYYDFILNLNPRRIIFNPGTENSDLVKLAMAKGITCEEACTLVLLSTGQF